MKTRIGQMMCAYSWTRQFADWLCDVRFRDRTLCGYRDTLYFLLAAFGQRKGNIIRNWTEFWAPWGVMVAMVLDDGGAACTFRCRLFPLVYSSTADQDLPICAGIFELSIIFSKDLWGIIHYIQKDTRVDCLKPCLGKIIWRVKLGKFSTHTSYALALWTQGLRRSFDETSSFQLG